MRSSTQRVLTDKLEATFTFYFTVNCLLDLHLVLSAFSLLNFFLYVTVNQTSVDMFSPTEKRIKYVQITIEKGM